MAIANASNRRRNVMLFSIFGLGGSYFILKARQVAETRRQQALAGEYHVRPERSGIAVVKRSPHSMLTVLQVVAYDRFSSIHLKHAIAKWPTQ